VLEHPDREKATRSSVAARAVALSSEELSELLRLRAEIGLLREQTNLIEQLKQENAQRNSEQQIQAAKSQSQLAEELSADTVACMEAVLKELPSACARFATDHEGKAPSAFHELRIYFTRDGHPLTGIFSFEFVREAGPKPGDTLILREVSSHFRDGKAVRVYGFADGTAKEMIFSDQEQEGREQIRWERAQLGLPERTFK
jgi:hypothetical protein